MSGSLRNEFDELIISMLVTICLLDFLIVGNQLLKKINVHLNSLQEFVG